jgi:hypothetical protein
VRQVHDGPPGATTRRLSSFLLIPVGYHRQGFAYGPQLNQTSIASSAIPVGATVHTSPEVTGIAGVNVPVLTISGGLCRISKS